MTEKEILDELGRIEVRTGAERTIKSYVLRSNTLDEGQRRLVCDQYENYCVGFHDGFIDPHSLFKDPSKEVIVEIGFGMGTSTQVIAQERDGYNYLCLEVYLQGFVKLLRDVSAKRLENIKLMRFNAVDVLERMIPPSSIAGFHIFFPDPWQKKRHHKRRLMNPAFLHLLAAKVRKGGYIYMVTDWEEYADEVLEISKNEALLSNPFGGFAPPVAWRPVTKFEQKGMESEHPINEIWLERK